MIMRRFRSMPRWAQVVWLLIAGAEGLLLTALGLSGAAAAIAIVGMGLAVRLMAELEQARP